MALGLDKAATEQAAGEEGVAQLGRPLTSPSSPSGPAMPERGDPVPWFNGRTASNPAYAFHSVAGRYVVLMFFGSARQSFAQGALARVRAAGALFDDERACFFGVSLEAEDAADPACAERVPGLRFFFDDDRGISRRFGVMTRTEAGAQFEPVIFLLDPMLRVLGRYSIADVDRMLAELARLPPPERHSGFVVPAPVLVVPRVFEPELCRSLIDYYHAAGGTESGFMRDQGGKTVGIVDPGFKRRQDCTIEDEALKTTLGARISKRLAPEIRKAFQFAATRMERYIVARYDGSEGGFFRAHRDNTTKATAHRRFAVTINLNAEDFAGGELRFPEFGPTTYRAPTGGAVVFSCSLLHEALPVTAGTRYAFLPFLYDEAGADIRQRTQHFLEPAENSKIA